MHVVQSIVHSQRFLVTLRSLRQAVSSRHGMVPYLITCPSPHQQHAVWNWIAKVMEDSQDLKHAYSEKKCREYNINVYVPAQVMSAADDSCLALQENQMDAAEDLLL